MIPTINKPTRKTATAIDHILTNHFVNVNFKTTIFKTDISDHFPVSIIISSKKKPVENKYTCVYKRLLQTMPQNVLTKPLWIWQGWNRKLFPEKILTIQENVFPRKKIKLKVKGIQSPWITSGIKKSFKRKQHLHKKFLKTRNQKSKLEYKNYKNLFETIKERLKKLYYSILIIKCKGNIKNMVSN